MDDNANAHVIIDQTPPDTGGRGLSVNIFDPIQSGLPAIGDARTDRTAIPCERAWKFHGADVT